MAPTDGPTPANAPEIILRTGPEFLLSLPEGSTIAFGAIRDNPERWIREYDGWVKIGSGYPFRWDEDTLLSYYPEAEGWKYHLEAPAEG